MYVIRDAITPSIQGYADALGFKNIMERHWPHRTLSDGTIVFDRLIWWQKGVGVLKTASHLAIYRAMRISVETLEAQEKDGIERLWFYLKPMAANAVSVGDIRTYVEQFTPQVYPTGNDPFNSDLDCDPVTDLNPDPYKDTASPLWDKDGWITTRVAYTPIGNPIAESSVTDAWIISKVNAVGVSVPSESITYNVSDSSRLTALALLDTNGVLFERKFTVLQKVIEDRKAYATSAFNTGGLQDIGRYFINSVVEMKFRRIADVNATSVTSFLSEIESKIDALQAPVPVYSLSGVTKKATLSLKSSIGSQLVYMANYTQPVATGEQYVVEAEGINGYYTSNQTVSLKADYLSDLTAKEFTTAFGTYLDTGYDEIEASWWEKALVVIITIIVIIVAIIAAIPSGGGSLALAAAVLSVGAMGLSLLSMYWAKNGRPGAAKFAAGGAELLGIAATIVGVTAAINQMMAQLAKEMLVQATLSGVGALAGTAATVGYKTGMISEDAAVVLGLIGAGASLANGLMSLNAASGAASSAATLPAAGATTLPTLELPKLATTGITTFSVTPTMQVANLTINMTNQLMAAYTKLVDPPGEGLSDKEAELESQEKEIATYNLDTPDSVWENYTDPYGNIFEVGDIYDRTCQALTEDRNRVLMNKYYDSGY